MALAACAAVSAPSSAAMKPPSVDTRGMWEGNSRTDEAAPALDPGLTRELVRSRALGPHGYSRPLTNKYGVGLQTYFWPASGAVVRAVVFLLHGNGCYLPFEWLASKGPGCHLYEGSWVEQLNAAGFSVVGLDFMGCGLSGALDDLPAFFHGFDDCVDDVLLLARHVDEHDIPGFTGRPKFLFGMSMGGCVTVHTMHKHPGVFEAAVLLSPMLSLEKVSKAGLNPYLKPIANMISYWYPSLPVAASSPNDMFPDLQAMWEADPYVYCEPTRARVATEYLAATEWVTAQAPHMDFPFIVFHSEEDTLCDCDGSQMLYDSSKADDKQLVLLTDMWHVLVKEDGNQKILNRILRWLDARTSPIHSWTRETDGLP